uniref:Uncharacterized protein n=1 Tax=Nelumbo nucifera TaxID=4432 RepID=A0A822ZQ16_NELNU|nr:TPA_asm: hypothetical protein HUJ06_016517 [Nelumbo nucifera]
MICIFSTSKSLILEFDWHAINYKASEDELYGEEHGKFQML